jgi:Tfp pilus assembly protein PilV
MKVTAQTSPASARRDFRRSVRAVTILEVMVAVMVLALTITSSLQVLGSGLRAMDTARYSTLAGQILQSQMEKLRLMNWSQLQNVEGINTPFTADVGTSSTSSSGGSVVTSNQVKNFSCIQTIQADSTYSNMIDIKLTASWSGMDGINHSRTYYTQYSQHGISDFIVTNDPQ